MGSAGRLVLVFFSLVCGGASCTRGKLFSCAEDSQCLAGETRGQCTSEGWCSFPDSSCESGTVYGKYSPPELAGACVPSGGDSSGPSQSTSDSTSQSEAGGPGSSSSGRGGLDSTGETETVGLSGGEDTSSAGDSTSGGPTEAGWVRVFSSPGLDWTTGLAIDSTGSRLFYSATCGGGIDLGEGSLPGFGGSDICVGALSADDGTPVWGELLGGTEQDASSDISTSIVGPPVRVAATFRASMTFGDQELATTAASTAAALLTFSYDGTPDWHNVFEAGFTTLEEVEAIPSGWVVAAGSGNADLTAGKLSVPHVGSPSDGFMSTTSQSGNLERIDTFAVADEDVVVDAVSSFQSEQIYAAGWTTGSLQIGAFALPVVSEAVFVAALNPNDGTTSWVNAVEGGGGKFQGRELAVDHDANVYLATAYTSGATVEGEPLAEGVLAVISFNSGGSYRWVQTIGGDVDTSQFGLAFDGDDIVLAGHLVGTADFPDGERHTDTSAAFVTRLTVDGESATTEILGEPGIDIVRALTSDGSGRLFLGGSFYVQADFGFEVAVADNKSRSAFIVRMPGR